MLGLRTPGDVSLIVADTAVALADLIDFDRGAYVLGDRRHSQGRRRGDDCGSSLRHPSTSRREARTLESLAR